MERHMNPQRQPVEHESIHQMRTTFLPPSLLTFACCLLVCGVEKNGYHYNRTPVPRQRICLLLLLLLLLRRRIGLKSKMNAVIAATDIRTRFPPGRLLFSAPRATLPSMP